MGRERKYTTAARLARAVEGYWNSISYERPVVVSVPTGAVDMAGDVRYASKILPITEREFFREPSVGGLCLHLGISKQTWSSYQHSEELGRVCEEFMLRLEDHLVNKLDGNKTKTVQGVVFNLKNNFGWKDKTDVVQTNVGMTMEEYLDRMEQDGKGQEF